MRNHDSWHADPLSLQGQPLHEAATKEWVALADLIGRTFKNIPEGSLPAAIPEIDQWDDERLRNFIRDVMEMRRRILEAE